MYEHSSVHINGRKNKSLIPQVNDAKLKIYNFTYIIFNRALFTCETGHCCLDCIKLC